MQDVIQQTLSTILNEEIYDPSEVPQLTQQIANKIKKHLKSNCLVKVKP